MSIINFPDNLAETLNFDPVAEMTALRKAISEIAPSFLDVGRDAMRAREQGHGMPAVHELVDVASQTESVPEIPTEEGLTPEEQQERSVAIAEAAYRQAYRDELRAA